MKKTISLSIPNPCEEKWANFSHTNEGGFCSSCNKVVVDFTRKSDQEILDFFANKQTHSCGRFRPEQLKSYAYDSVFKVNPGLALLKASALSLLLVFMNKQAEAQTPNTKPKTETIQQATSIAQKGNPTAVVVKGVVTSAEDKMPMPGVNVYVKGSEIGTITDAQGRFKLPSTLTAGQVVLFSFIGCKTREYVITTEAKDEIQMTMATDYIEMLGDVAVGGVYTAHQSGLSKWWNKLKRVF